MNALVTTGCELIIGHSTDEAWEAETNFVKYNETRSSEISMKKVHQSQRRTRNTGVPLPCHFHDYIANCSDVTFTWNTVRVSKLCAYGGVRFPLFSSVSCAWLHGTKRSKHKWTGRVGSSNSMLSLCKFYCLSWCRCTYCRIGTNQCVHICKWNPCINKLYHVVHSDSSQMLSPNVQTTEFCP